MGRKNWACTACLHTSELLSEWYWLAWVLSLPELLADFLPQSETLKTPRADFFARGVLFSGFG
jgi:hypothetical protein